MVAATTLQDEAMLLTAADGEALTVADREAKADEVVLGVKVAPGVGPLVLEVRLKLLMLELVFKPPGVGPRPTNGSGMRCEAAVVEGKSPVRSA